MISCTEFIPAYSELFRFIETKEGYEGVEEYWNVISDLYVEERLGDAVRKQGLAGCFSYWSHTLNEEAADFTMTLDEEKGYFEIVMHHCPSKGRLLEYTHMTPYDKYDIHCDVLYRRVLEKFGFVYVYDLPQAHEANCRLRVFDPEVADSKLIQEAQGLA